MAIFGIIFFIILAVFLFGLSILTNILRAIFGIGKRTADSFTGSDSKKQQSKTKMKDTEVKKKKVFDDDEGEYVEFEEINDPDEIKK